MSTDPTTATTAATAPDGEVSTDGRLKLGVHEAAERTFAQICQGVPEIETGGAPPDGEGISAAIDYTGALEFTVVLAVPRATAGPLMKTFTGVPIDFDSEVMEDVVGELLNVLAGDVVAELSNHGLEVRMALPRVERSLDPATTRPGTRAVETLAVRAEAGPFAVALLVPDEDGGDGR